MKNSFLTLCVALLCVASVSAEFSVARNLLNSPSQVCTKACKAVKGTDPERIRHMLKKGYDLCGCICNTTTNETLIHASVESKCGLCIKLLTKKGKCDCDLLDAANNTALHYAAEQCRMEIAADLINAGCNVTAQNNVTDTPLCVTSRTDNEECGGLVRAFIEEGADSCDVCSDNVTAIDGCVNKVVCDIFEQDTEEECEDK